MATTFATLKTEIADFVARNDLSSVVGTFIQLCEAEMQRKLKLLPFETTSQVTITAGSGSIPTGYAGWRAAWWSDNPNRLLTYVPPHELERIKASDPSYVNYYTVTGTALKTADDKTGTLNVTHLTKFTPLSDSNTSNDILANHPAAYLYGSLVHFAAWDRDAQAAASYRALFEAECAQIKTDNADKKFAGPLVVRPA